VLNNKSKISDPVFHPLNKVFRVFWWCGYFLFFRFSPIPLFKFRTLVLRMFFSNISFSARIYPSAKVWNPRNLTVGRESTIGPLADIYNQGGIIIKERVIISQKATLCASTHDYNHSLHPLILKPIVIENNAWVCAEAFIGPGVTIGEGAVIGARAVLMKDAEPWSVYAGNPAIKIKTRKRFDES
jgi:putative colanic acid biosynthesis acetyltransferase WcaF